MTLHPRSRLREKQRIIIDEILSNDAKLIVSGMGSGKTAATLTALRDLLDSTLSQQVLVIAPLRVATDVWPQEIQAWAHTRLIGCAVACGTEAQRIAAVAKQAEITIINRENLVWLAKHLGSVENWPYDTVVIDESSMFKKGSKRTTRSRTKAADGTVKVNKGGNLTRFGVLTTARRKIRRIYELTGTPAPNGVEDLWGQMYLLDQGAALGRTKSAFLDRWFDVNPYTHQTNPKPGAEQEIMAAIRHLMVSLPSDKLVEDPVFIRVPVTLPPKVMLEYNEFEKSLVSETYDVEAVSKGVLANKLLQFANGSMYREDGSVAFVHDEKMKALDALVEEAQGENLLVFYGFKFDLQALRKRYPQAVVLNESSDAVEQWNAGKIKMLLAHPASCAHGLNLQFGGHICIWYGLTWSLELFLQANARLPRPGQKNLVAIYKILANGTYDEDAEAVLERKDATQTSVINSVLYRVLNGAGVQARG